MFYQLFRGSNCTRCSEMDVFARCFTCTRCSSVWEDPAGYNSLDIGRPEITLKELELLNQSPGRPQRSSSSDPSFMQPNFAARAGLPYGSPLRKIIQKEGADEAGAKRFIWWILSPRFHHLDVPPPVDASVAPLPQRAKRQRGKRKHKGQQPPNEDQERTAKHRKIAPAVKHVPSLQREVLFEALMDPVLHMLKKTPAVNFQELLSKHSPSHRALLILKVFEQKNQRLGDHALPSICGLRCSCHTRRPKAKVSKETRARSGNLFQCTGGYGLTKLRDIYLPTYLPTYVPTCIPTYLT